MTQLGDGEFEVIGRRAIVESKEKRPYGKDHTMLVYCFERPVTVRRSLSCQQCDQGFEYEFETVLRWEQSYQHETTEQDALRQTFAREHHRTSTPGHDNPVICPHCGAVQSVGNAPPTRSAKVLAWFRKRTGRDRQHD